MSFAKILSGTQLECQTFWMQTRNDFQLVLILVLTVCKVISRRHCLSDKMLYTVTRVFLRGTDKSPLGQKPTRTKAHWTIAHWTKAHCLIWQGGQKPTFFKKKRIGLFFFIKLSTLIRLLQGKSHLQCAFTDIIILLYVML